MARRQMLEIAGVSHGAAPIPMGVRIGNLIFSSGIMGQDPETQLIPAEPDRQAALVFANMRRLVELGGGSTDDIAHVTVYLKDNQYRAHVNVEWLKMFPNADDRPARHTVLYDLAGGMLIQCELVAVLG